MIDAILNGINVKEQYGLILTNKVIGNPSIERMTIKIPLVDGELDITESMVGKSAIYGNREIELTFAIDGKDSDVYALVNNLYHGKNITISFSDESDWFYRGNCNCSIKSVGGHYQIVTMKIDCQPYQMNASNERRL